MIEFISMFFRALTKFMEAFYYFSSATAEAGGMSEDGMKRIRASQAEKYNVNTKPVRTPTPRVKPAKVKA